MLIVGAGLSGLLAGVLNPTASIIEAREREDVTHRALLRFREDKISKATGIDFRRVVVRKEIFGGVYPKDSSIWEANSYSMKVSGVYSERSIWNLAPEERYIAPETFMEQMIEMCERRIGWNIQFREDMAVGNLPIISTMPMPEMLKIFPVGSTPTPLFAYKSIVVDRYRIIGCDIYQTIYFPQDSTPIYRASISGDMLIIERIDDRLYPDEQNEFDHDAGLALVCSAFGIVGELEPIHVNHRQQFGKIVAIDNDWRRKAILDLSVQHGIYSLGRFACWRNILLDDVYNDLFVIRRLLKSSHYEHHLTER